MQPKCKQCGANVKAYRRVDMTVVYQAADQYDDDPAVEILSGDEEVHHEEWWTECEGLERHQIENGWIVGIDDETGEVSFFEEGD